MTRCKRELCTVHRKNRLAASASRVRLAQEGGDDIHLGHRPRPAMPTRGAHRRDHRPGRCRCRRERGARGRSRPGLTAFGGGLAVDLRQRHGRSRRLFTCRAPSGRRRVRRDRCRRWRHQRPQPDRRRDQHQERGARSRPPQRAIASRPSRPGERREDGAAAVGALRHAVRRPQLGSCRRRPTRGMGSPRQARQVLRIHLHNILLPYFYINVAFICH